MGIATDDSHEYHGQPGSRPGRGWVMVRSRYLTPEHLIRAMKKGDFYASSGVKLKDVQFNESKKILSLEIDADANATYKTEFIGTLEHPDEESRVGKVLATSTDPNPSYQMKGNELYVRAVVTSSLDAVDPSFKGQKSRLGLNLWDGTHKKVSYFLLPVPRKRDHRKACCFYNDKPSQPLCAIRRVCGVMGLWGATE